MAKNRSRLNPVSPINSKPDTILGVNNRGDAKIITQPKICIRIRFALLFIITNVNQILNEHAVLNNNEVIESVL